MTEEIIGTTPAEELTDNDKLWGMLSWLPFVGWILAILALVMEPQKDSPFIKHHAVQSLASAVVLSVIGLILGITVVLSCLSILLPLVTIYPAIKAYQGEEIEIPVITDFCKGQGWI